VLGLAIHLGTEFLVKRRANNRLEQKVRPVRFENAELVPVLQDVLDSVPLSIRLSMCPELSSRRVTLTTRSEMPLKDFLVLLAAKVGAEVDLAHRRHVSLAEPFRTCI
jgi:hypothetical protein